MSKAVPQHLSYTDCKRHLDGHIHVLMSLSALFQFQLVGLRYRNKLNKENKTVSLRLCGLNLNCCHCLWELLKKEDGVQENKNYVDTSP